MTLFKYLLGGMFSITALTLGMSFAEEGAGGGDEENNDDKPPDASDDNEEEEDQTGSDDSQAEIASLKAALKKANNESAGRRKKIEAFEKQENERKQAEMTELEQANAALETAQAKVADAEGALNTERIKRAVDLVAMGMNFHSPSNAYALADRSEIAVDEGGKVTGVEDALKALAKQQPHLINTEKAPNLDGDKRSDSEGESIDEDDIKMRYGI